MKDLGIPLDNRRCQLCTLARDRIFNICSDTEGFVWGIGEYTRKVLQFDNQTQVHHIDIVETIEGA